MKALLIALLAMPAFAIAADESPYASVDEPHGVVRGDFSRRSEDIYPVQIRKVDGKEFPGMRSVMYLTPGEHTITAFVAATVSSIDIRPGRRDDDPQELTLEIEAGKTYQVGAKLNRNGRQQWSIILWKVE